MPSKESDASRRLPVRSFGISSHLFGLPRPEDETLLIFPNSGPGAIGLVGESVPASSNFPTRDMHFELPAEATIDPFNGISLIVKKLPEGWTVYSVGSDLVDGGGMFDGKTDVCAGLKALPINNGSWRIPFLSNRATRSSELTRSVRLEIKLRSSYNGADTRIRVERH
jgi:hypothetical protein